MFLEVTVDGTKRLVNTNQTFTIIDSQGKARFIKATNESGARATDAFTVEEDYDVIKTIIWNFEMASK